jgi:hypothetical protein
LTYTTKEDTTKSPVNGKALFSLEGNIILISKSTLAVAPQHVCSAQFLEIPKGYITATQIHQVLNCKYVLLENVARPVTYFTLKL